MVTDGFPSFGPILSAIGPPTYKFAKFLFPVQGPYQLMSILLKIPSYLAEELVMASFDTESLFTNIHLQETIVKKKQQPRNKSLCELLARTMTEWLILFDQAYYKQDDRVPMGSSLGLTPANVFFVTMKISDLKIFILNLNLSSVEGTLIIHSYLFGQKITSKNSEITLILNIKISDTLYRPKVNTPYHFLTLK